MQLLNEIRELNSNVCRVLEKLIATPIIQRDWVYIKDVEKMLGRKRTWIKGRSLPAGTSTQSVTNVNEWLFYGVDWKHEGKLLIFNAESVNRLKRAMQSQ